MRSVALLRCPGRAEDKGGRCCHGAKNHDAVKTVGGSGQRSRSGDNMSEWRGRPYASSPIWLARLHCAVGRPRYSFLFIPGIFQYSNLHQTL
jgi:hypothetical protein